MSGTKRRINSTGRRRIKVEHIDVRMQPLNAGEPPIASVKLELGEYGFPASANVVLEAYQRLTSVRFEFGTLSDMKVPDHLRLEGLDRAIPVLFRLKVVDADSRPGLILGSAEHVRPNSGDEGDNRKSIFPIHELDLEDHVWRVYVDEAGPVLQLNNRVAGFKHSLLENPLLLGVILPAALRSVLSVLADDPPQGVDDDDEWKTQWLQYLTTSLDLDEELSDLPDEEIPDWIEEAVRRFSKSHRFIDRIRDFRERGQ